MSTLSTPDRPLEAQTPKRASSRTKAIVAIAAGTALLLGGAGTLAYWSTSQSLTAGTVTSGDLDLTLGTGVWTLDGVLTSPTVVADPSTVRIVPGDMLTLEQPVTVTLVGDNLEADLTVDVTAAIPSANANDFTVALTVTGATANGVNTYRLKPADVTAPLQATLTITFNSATADRVAVNTAIDLSKVTFNLTQAGVTTTGNFSVTASWLGGTPAWPSLFPGARTPDTKIRVTQAGNGTTLGWRVRVSSTVNPAFASDVTFQAWAGDCGTGVLIPAGGYPSTGHLTQNTSVDVCVRYTLAALAPGTLQGKGLTPNITITGEQVGG